MHRSLSIVLPVRNAQSTLRTDVCRLMDVMPDLAGPLAGRSFFAVDPETEAGARAALAAAEACTPPEPPEGLLRPWGVLRDEIVQGAGLPS